MMLGKGQRDGDVEIIDIDAAAGKVRIRTREQELELSFSAELLAGTAVASGAAPAATESLRQPAAFRLQQTGPDLVFQLYQLLAGRTLIRPAALPNFRVSLYSESNVTTGDLLNALEQALGQQGVRLRTEGDRFAVAIAAGAPDYITADMRKAAAGLAKAFLKPSSGETEIPAASATQKPSPGNLEILPAGVINFPHTDFNQVVMIFGELANRTVIRPATLPSPAFSIRTYSPLTRGEALFAFTAVLAANGLAVVPAGDKFMLVCPVFQRAQVEALVERTLATNPGVAADATPPATIDLNRADLNQVLALYREVNGRTIEVADSLPRPRFWLRSQTPLTSAEVLSALDLLLGVNGFEVVPGNDSTAAKLLVIGATAK
jgi:hypothetical protein